MVKKNNKVVKDKDTLEEGLSEVVDSVIDDNKLDLAPNLKISRN